MRMKIVARGRAVSRFTISVIILAALVAMAALIDNAFAQGNPFGGPRPGTAPVPAGGIVGWLFAKQAEFYRQFSGLIRASKADGTAAWSLMGVSFLYGIFHAAGPGHGKAVISSYLVASDETWVRGVVLSLLSALMQAAVAVMLVGIAAVLLHASAATMNRAVNWIETLSYSLIILIGARLLWVKGRAFIGAFRLLGTATGEIGAAVTAEPAARTEHSNGHEHAHDSCDGHDHAHHEHHRHAHHDHEDDASAWGTLTRPNRRNWPAPAAGGVACRRSWQWGCDRARARSWCWSSRLRRACSWSAWHRPS
jgi:nickel/cobalt exporter